MFGLLWWAACTSAAPAQGDPRETLAWLRSLTVEGRLALNESGAVTTPRLFTETLPDGRSWMTFVADDLGATVAAGDWALLDEAVSICLAEAGHLKQLAVAVAGSPDEAALNAIRKHYLEGAAQLLGHYRAAASDSFDENAGGLVGVPALPDWALPLLSPGEIEIREMAGAGRLNVETLAFSGRLSGLIQIPGLESTLAVPNFSFDTMGNIDLTAYGQTVFPPNDPDGVTLAIPPRRPLSFHLGADGNFAAAGGLRLEFPGGNVIEGDFDIVDPDYEFGFAFSGSLTIELAKEIALIRPVVDFDPVAPLGLEALAGFGQFFGSLGAGLEVYLAESPALPSFGDLDIGVAPEFEAPQTAVPLDVWDAWMTGLANEHVRPALNGSLDATLGPVREVIGKLKDDIATARNQTGADLAQMKRLRRIAQLNADMQFMLEVAAAREALGVDGSEFQLATLEAANEAVALATEYLENTPADADFRTGFAAIRLLLQTEATATLSGADYGLDLGLALAKLDQWETTAYARFGFNRDGTVADQATVDALSRDDFHLLALVSFELEAMRQLMGRGGSSRHEAFLRLAFERTRDAYNAATASGDLENRAVQSMHLLDLAAAHAAIGFSASEAEQLLMFTAFQETFDHIANRGSGGATGQKLATSFLEAARNQVEVQNDRMHRRRAKLFGETQRKPEFSETLDFSFYEYSFFEKVHASAAALEQANLLDAAVKGNVEASLTSFLAFFREAHAAKFSDASLVTQNFQGAYDSLTALLDAIAFLEDFLPGEGPLLGEFETSWQALHLEWTLVAEARRAHWHLAAYLREITDTAGRYGDGVGAALEASFAAAGTEAGAGLQRVVDALAGLLDTVGTEDFQFALPGDAEVQRLFGQLAFNRITGDWSVGFGGKVAFPDINANFELESATLASNGDFALAILTDGPVPFGLLDATSLDIATAFNMTGNLLTPVIDNASASGVFTFTPEVGSPASYNVDLDYSFLDPDHRFHVTASFADPTELFTPEIVLFSGGFGFDLQTNAGGQPTQLGADVALAAGVLLRPEAAGMPLGDLTPDDFYLHFDGMGGLDFSADDQTVALSVAAGTALTLPRDLFSPAADETMPATVTLATDVCMQYSFETGELSFCDVNGDPVEILFQDILLAIPSIDGLEADLHSATLVLSGTALPVLTGLDATLSIPLPGDAPALVAINDGEFRLDGLPTGTITLLNDSTLFEAGGFSFTLLGSGSGLCPEPTLLSLTDTDPDPLVTVPRLELSGGLLFTVPADILQADVAGDPVIDAIACGAGFILEAGQDPRLTLDSLTIDATGTDFLFTGEAGLRIGNPNLFLDNIDQLWSPDGSGVFSVSISGQLAIDGVGGFGLNDATFYFPRGELPEFSLAGVNFRLGNGMGLDIDFPSRAGFFHDQGETFLEFGVIEIDFTEDSPIQFIGELNFSDAGQNRRLSLTNFSFEELASALALDPGDGVGVKIYDYLTAIWYGGELIDGGIRNASFSLTSKELPLPDTRLTIPLLTFRQGEPVRFAFYGDFDLRDLTPTPTKVRVPPNRPVWLEVSPNSLRLGGRVEVMMEGGTTFAGELLLDDPFYQIKIEADGLTIPLVEGLAGLLPANPGACLPAVGNDDDAQLDAAAACLKTYAEAYANFTATVAGAAVAGADPGAAPPTEPPGPFNSAVSVLEAWSWSALTPTAQAMPLQQLVEFFDFSCDATAATQDAETVTRYLLALKRALQAIEDGALDGTQAEMDALEAALADAELAIIARAREPEATASLESLDRTLEMLLEIEAINQEIGESSDPVLLDTLIPDLLDRGTRAYLASLGVEAGVFLPDTNPVINEMNRFVAFGTLRDLLDLMAKAAVLGVDDEVSGPMFEAQTQLAHRFYALNQAALSTARAAGDLRSFQYALEDLLELESFRALGIFSDHPSLDLLPGLAELAGFAQDLGDMFLADLDRPYGDRTYRNQLVTLRGLLSILEEMPAGVTFASLPFENALDRMDEALDEAVLTLVLNESCAELALLLESGLVHSRLMDRFGRPLAYDWDGADGYLAQIVTRFVTVAQAGKCWSQLHEAACLLIEESRSDALEAQLPRRRAYLENAVTLLNAARMVAIDCWNDEGNRRNADPALAIADVILPGDIQLDDVAGSARYNRRTGEFGGALSGTMRLPKFDASLTLNNASFSSGGAFDLNAFGTITLPPGGDAATLSIPERRPLHVSFAPPNDFSLTGGAMLTMANGMEFEAHLTIDDPEYAFGASMKGVRFDLANQMTFFVPELPNNAEVFPEVSGRVLARYFESLNGTLETLAPIADLSPLAIGDPGTPPEFVSPTLDNPLQPLELWTNSALADLERGLGNSYTGTTDFLREQIRLLALDLKELTKEVKNLDAIATRNRALRRATELLARMADESLLGGDPGHEEWAELRLALDEALAAARCLLEIPGNQQNLWRANRAARAVLDAAAADAAAGGNDPILAELVVFYDLVLNNLLAQYGFDSSGAQTDPGALEGITREELEDVMRSLLDTLAVFVAMGGHGKEAAVFDATATVLFTLRDRIVTDLREVGAEDFGAHLELAMALFQIVSTAEQTGFDYPAQGELLAGGQGAISLADDIQAAVDEMEAALDKQMRLERRLAANPGERFYRDLVEAFEKAGRTMRSDLQAFLNQQVEFRADQLEQFISEDWPAGRIRDGLGALEEMIDLLAWMEAQNLPQLPQFRDVHLPDLTVKFTSAAEAQKAWWLLTRYTELLYDASLRKVGNDTTLLANAFQTAASDTIRASKNLADALALLLPSLRPVEIALPGDLVIESAYGEIFYNRETAFLQGSFGGRVSFPEANTYFEIIQLTIANDGSFSIDLTTGGEIPFGDSTQVNFEVPLVSGSGDLAGNFAFSGAASLAFLDPADPINATVVAATIDYSTATDLIEFTGQLSNLQLVDDLVVLNGNLAAQISTASPNGSITIGGGPGGTKIGLLARQKPIPNSPPTELDFYLTLGIEPTTFTYSPDELTAMFTGGSITLPPDIFSKTTDGVPNGDPATIALTGNLCIAYNFNDSALSFCNDAGEPFTLAFNDIGFEVPGLPGSLIAIDDTELLLAGTDFPTLTSLNATFAFPLPGADYSDPAANRAVQIDLAAEDWRLDGLPAAASIILGQPLRILDFDGFDIDVLAGTGMFFTYDPVADEMMFEFVGGMNASFDPNLLWDAGEGAGAAIAGEGSFSWIVGQLPTFAIDNVTVVGNFRLGGADGIGIKGTAATTGSEFAVIQLLDLQNLFLRTADNPFRIWIDGAMDIANFIEFGLEDTYLIWDGTTDGETPAANNLIPRFEPGGFYSALGENAIELAGEFLPLYPTLIGLRFKNSALPLFPAQNQTGLFDPTNVIAIVSGVISLPNGAAIEAGSPGFSGSVDLLEIAFVFDNDLGLYVPDLENIDLNGFCVQLSNLDIPPLGGITGGICIGNLNALTDDPPRPQDVYFAGNLGGKVKDIGASILFAAKPTEFIGACFELDAGPAGIPIDGGMLGGILLTGGRGGINFKNQFSDPCDFATYIDLGSDVPARGDRPGNPAEPPAQVIPPDFDGGPISCVSAPFPPPSVNPLCEEFPADSGRFIFKGTRLTEGDLNSVGITRSSVGGLAVEEIVNMFVDGTLGLVESELQDAVMAATDAGTPLEAVEFFMNLADSLLQSFDDAATSVLLQAIRSGLSVDPDQDIYDILVAKAAEGIPCFDFTLLVGGTISHSTISTVLSGSGNLTLSSTGTAVFDGSINLIGIPVATGTLALSITNDQGMIDPAFGGLANVALGPLDLAELSLAISCQGCFTAVVTEFANLLACQGAALGPEAVEFAYQMLEATFPGETFDRGTSLLDHFTAPDFDTQKQLAYLSAFFNYFQLVVNGDPLPVTIDPAALDNFRDCFIDFVIALFPQVNPFICFSGEIGPKLFGFPLTGGADTLLGASLVYGRVEDPNTGVQFQELIASTEFSPTFMMLSAVMGTYSSAIPAVDTASMGYSLRIPAFTEDTVELLLTDPLQFASDQFTTLVNDAVLAFSYGVAPMGIDLASGQGRMIMPRLDSHPENPNRTLPAIGGVNPEDRWGGLLYGSELDAFIAAERDAGQPVKLPTRTELILAALSKGQLKNPRWRGTHADLATLFTDPAIPLDPEADPDDPFAAGYTSSNATCDQLTGEVAVALEAADPGLVELSRRSLPDDYFPHGGLIGGAELAFPNVLANEMPGSQLTRLFTAPATVQEFTDEWLPNAQRLFANPNDPDPEPGEPGYAYFTGTNCVGQMALYLPAPNPIVPDPDNPGQFNVIDFQTANLADMVASLQAVDFQSVVEGADAFFPDEEILLTGWLDAPILGMPVARGSMNYNNNTKIFNLHAEVPPDTWLADWVGAELDFEITPPEYQLDSLDPEGAAEKLQAIGDSLATAALGNTQGIIDEIATTMPKVSASAAVNLVLPPEAAAYLNTSAAANLELFAFSPAFEPDYLPADDSPYAVARRRGGLGLTGDFQLGYFPDTGEPIVIDVENASFALLPSSQPTLFPALAGSLRVNELTFNPNLPTFTDGELSFATEPDNLAPYLTLAGHLEPFKFVLPGTNIDLLTFQALDPGGTIGGTLSILRDDSIPGTATGTSLEIEPMSANIPFLGKDVAITVYGDEPKPGVYTPFSFATTGGAEWEATMCLSSPGNPSAPPTFQICDPYNPGGPCLLEFTPSAPVCGTLSGVGLGSFQLALQIPAGFSATFYPDTDAEVTQTIGGAGHFSLYIDSNGRFFVDFGPSSNVGLPGALTAGGHLSFGLNPDGNNPNVVPLPGTLNLGSADLVETASASITIQNQGTAEANVILSTSPGNEFIASSSGFNLAPGASKVVDVVFSPQAIGVRNGSLFIESNDPRTPLRTVPLSGTGTAAPRFFKSRNSIAFGDTLINATSKASLTIGNDGSAPMQITGITLPNSQFAITPSGPATVAPGDSISYVVSFTAANLNTASGNITFPTASLGSHSVFVFGRGTRERWVTLLDSRTAGNDATLNDILMFDDARRGFVAGDAGTVLETADGGRSWIPRRLTSYDMKALAMKRMIDNQLIAAYHFEEPPGSRFFRDESPNAYHGSTPSFAESPEINYIHGRIGSGLRFDDVNDSVDLATFDLPANWAIAMWVNPSTTTDGQAFLGKNAANGGNQFIFGFYDGGYHVRFNSTQTFTGGIKQTGWQHLVLTGSYSGTTDTTTVRLYRNDVELWNNAFTGAAFPMNNGKPWSIGQEWDSSTARSDFFGGQLDELYFFNGILTTSERDHLFNASDSNALRLVMAGSDGMVFESLTGGRAWTQLADQNVLGWRSRFGLYFDYDYNTVAITNGGKILLGGSKNGNRLLLLEDAYAGGNPDPQVPEDDEFDEVAFDAGAGSGAGEPVWALGDNSNTHLGTSLGRFYRANSASQTYFRHGTLDLTGSVRDLFVYGFQDWVAVGDNGAIVHSLNNSDPAIVAPGLTTANLWSVTDDRNFHAVGDNGAYLTSTTGTSWNLIADGLTGNMRGVAAVDESFVDLVWAVGEDHLIQYRPRTEPSGPFLTVFPGELDFGFLLRDKSRTLPLTVTNRGTSDLDIGQVAISGAPFSIKQTALGAIPAGDSVTLFVRYNPALFDLSGPHFGELTLATNDPAASLHRVRLRGRSYGRNWQPVFLGVEGRVVDLDFVSTTTGYALVDLGPAAHSRLYKTTNGGLTSTSLPLILPRFDVLQLTGMDFSASSPATGYLSGSIKTAAGNFVQGIVLKTTNSGGSWSSDFTPDDVGNRGRVGNTQPLVDIKVSEVNPNIVVTCNSAADGTGDFWQTTNGGILWENHQQTPSDNFDGLVVGHVANTIAGNNFSLVMASSGSRLYSKQWQNNWLRLFTNGMTVDFPAKVFNANQVIRDFRFYDDPAANFLPDYGWIVGDRGLFWRWDSGGPAGADWYPPANAEVFGPTDLAKVSFHNPTTGWVVGESRIFDSTDGGRSWNLHFDAGTGAHIAALDSFTDSTAWAGGALGDQALVWRYRAASAPDAPILAADDLEILAPTVPRGTSFGNVQIRNTGDTLMRIHQISIESDDPLQRWSITSKPSVLIAGLTTNIGVRFEATPERIDLPALDPEVFLRFEDERAATTYLDCSPHHRDGTAAPAADQQPAIARADDARDFCLQFDGNDYAEVNALNSLPGDYSFSIWANPDGKTQFEVLFGKHTSSGANLVLGGLNGQGIYFNIRNQTFTSPTGRHPGWQHLVFNCRNLGSQTEVAIYQDGALLHQQVLAAVAGTVTGKPWVLGAEWDSSTIINDFFSGCLDDFAMFNRLLTEDEIRMLANKSPVTGIHEARLVINSDSEDGKYAVDLRAEVLPGSRMVTFHTEPPGLPITIDGVNFTAPVSFGVGNVAGQREWCEGSIHTVEAAAGALVAADGGTDLTYEFAGWDTAANRQLSVTASTAATSYTARYEITAVTDPNPPPRALEPPPARGLPGFNLSLALAGTPQGPFLRLVDGSLSVPALGASGFTMEGELFLSLTKMTASLSTTALDFPATGTPKWIELGASNWLLDWEDDSHFLLKAQPPSLTLLGLDVSPATQFCLELNENNNLYRAIFDLDEPFTPLPHLFQIKPGGVALQYNGGTSFTLTMDGGMRVLDLPPLVGVPDWAIDQSFDLIFTSPNIDLSLATLFAQAGIAVPADFFDTGVFALDWGDIQIDNNPSWSLEVNGLSLSIYGQTVSTVSGTAGLDGTLALNGTLPTNLNVPLLPGSAFSVRPRAGGSTGYSLEFQTAPELRLAVDFPGMSLRSSVAGFPAGGLNVPGITFDTGGTFDSGKLALPNFSFDGIAISGPDDGDLDDNYIRLRRQSDGDILFDVRAQFDPFASIPVIPDCGLHDFSLTVENTTVDASLQGTFCVFPEPISLEYNSGSNCQFQGGTEDYTIFFGSSCAGYRNEWTGICIGDCTP